MGDGDLDRLVTDAAVREIAGLDRSRCKPRHPLPHYPDADLHDTGEQRGWWWAREQFAGHGYDHIAAAAYWFNAYVLPRSVFDRLTGGVPTPYACSQDSRYRRVYATVEEAMGDLRQAAEGVGT